MITESTQKGNVGLTAFRLACQQKGYITSIADEGSPYDVVVDKLDGKLYRCQVKYMKLRSSGTIEVRFDYMPTKGQRRIYDSANIDALVVYEPTTQTILWIAVEDRASIMTIRFTPTKNNIKKGVRMSEDYLEW